MVRATVESSGSTSGAVGEATRVLVADGQFLARKALWHLFAEVSDVEVVAEAGNCEDALRAAEANAVEVILADFHLPTLGVLDLLRRIGSSRRPAVLVTSEFIDGSMACRALDAGALGYVTHNSPPTVLAAAVRTVAAGKPYLGADVVAEVAYRRVNASNDPMASLSSREFEIFRLLSEGRSIAEVAQVLSLSTRSVANYQAHIKRKLGVATTAGLVHLALRHHVIRVGSGS